jgi:hypothetical protein
MSESITTLSDEEMLSFEIPDAALKLAGRKLCEGLSSSATVAFCSGLDTCPSSPVS